MPIIVKLEESRYLPKFKNKREKTLFIKSFEEQGEFLTDFDLIDEQVLNNWDTSWAAKGIFTYLAYKNKPISLNEIYEDSSSNKSTIDQAIKDLEELDFISLTDKGISHIFDSAEGNETRNESAWSFIGTVLEDRLLEWEAKGIFVMIARNVYESTWYGLMHFSPAALHINQLSGSDKIALHPNVNKLDNELSKGLQDLLNKEYIERTFDQNGKIRPLF